jgi:pyrroloquinoline quinone (PQQ) biosynthesis protein C
MYFEAALADTEAVRSECIEQHPVFQKIHDGTFTRWHYLVYLKETYHLVQHTPHYLRVAAQRLDGENGWLRDYYLKLAVDETGHELLCVHDIRALNEEPETVLHEMPLGGSWAMVTQNYYLSAFGNPVSLIGDTIATEGLGAGLATSIADVLEDKYAVPHAATTFLRVHGEADIEHIDGARMAMERFGSEKSHYNEITHIWRMTLRYYGQLFADVMAQGDAWNEEHAGVR